MTLYRGDVGFALMGALSRRGDFDTYADEVAFLELDFHFDKAQFGSRQPFVQ